MKTENKLAGKSVSAGNVPGRKSKAYRDRLLTRLPRLGAPDWDPRGAFDVQDSMTGLRDLGADSFLEPLARFAEPRGE